MSSPKSHTSVIYNGDNPVVLENFVALLDQVLDLPKLEPAGRIALNEVIFFRQVVGIMQRATAGATSLDEVSQRILAELAVASPAQGAAGTPQPPPRFRFTDYSVMADPDCRTRYEPQPYDGKGRPRSPSPPPPDLPVFMPTEQKLDIPNGGSGWYRLPDAWKYISETEKARIEAERTGRPPRKVPPPKAEVAGSGPTFMAPMTTRGLREMPPRDGFAYQDVFQSWAKDVNNRRRRDGVAKMVPLGPEENDMSESSEDSYVPVRRTSRSRKRARAQDEDEDEEPETALKRARTIKLTPYRFEPTEHFCSPPALVLDSGRTFASRSQRESFRTPLYDHQLFSSSESFYFSSNASSSTAAGSGSSPTNNARRSSRRTRNQTP